jgi:hypothetical protein
MQAMILSRRFHHATRRLGGSFFDFATTANPLSGKAVRAAAWFAGVMLLSAQPADALYVIGPAPGLYSAVSDSGHYDSTYTAANLFNFNVAGIPLNTQLNDSAEFAKNGGGTSYVAFSLDQVYTNVGSLFYAQRSGGIASADKVSQISVWTGSTPFAAMDPGTSPDTVVTITNAQGAIWNEYLMTNFISGQYFLLKLDQAVDDGNPGGRELRLGSTTPSTNTVPPAAQLWTALGISEFMADNEHTVTDEDGDYSGWVEIFNPTASDLSLGNWFLTSSSNNLTQWQIPNVTVPANDYIVIFASGKNRTNVTAELHTNFKLSVGGGYLALVDPNNNVVSVFDDYPAQTADVSYGRDAISLNDIGYFANPTPANANSATGYNAAPGVVFSQAGGTFTNPFQLEITDSVTNAAIYYTLDGSPPTVASLLYTQPITVSNSVQVRARVFESGLMPGAPHSETYLLLANDLVNTNSDLPAIVIYNFDAGSVPQDGDQFANIAVYEPSNGVTSLTNPPTFNTRALIEVHGSSTAAFPKQAFSVDFVDDLNNDANYTPLGLPAQSDFILYAPDPFEPVLIHNPLIYQISNDIGRYAPRTRMCEVYLNTSGGALSAANYNGIYVLEERITWDPNRVNINKTHNVDQLHPNDNTGTNVTGGYIMKIDRLDPGDSGFNSAGQLIVYDKPSEDNITMLERIPQQQYLQTYMDSFGDALNSSSYTNLLIGYPAYVDVPSAIDHHILNVMAFNVDALRLSAYFYKDRNDKIFFGPIWDFDRSQGSTDGRDFSPLYWSSLSPPPDFGTDYFNYSWWGRMFTDIDFWQAWIDRYQDLRTGPLSTNHIYSVIDSLVAQVQHEQPREVARWPSLTTPRSGTITIYNYSYTFPGTYQGEVSFLKQWYADRLNFMDTNFLPRPALNSSGGGFAPGFSLVMTSPGGGGIYYTTNGLDPRISGGTIRPGALAYTGPIPLTTNTTFMARAFNPAHQNLTGTNNPPLNSPWSGLIQAVFVPATAPVIMQSPTGLDAYIGQSPVFTVQTTGSPTPGYQWKFNSVNLAGQTNSQLTLANLQTNQSGIYSFTASNAFGSATASFALNVTVKPNLVITEAMSSESKGTNNSTLDHEDWWELSNLGAFAVNLQGYRFDDSHDSLTNGDVITNAVSIAPGESIVLAEDMTPTQFQLWWGAAQLPAHLQIITYPSIGFSSSGDNIYLWNAAATSVTDTVAAVAFPAATRGVSFSYNLNTQMFGQLSAVGTRGAFTAAVNGDIGSPGYFINSPRFTQLSFSPRSGLMLSFAAQPERSYFLQYKTNLTDSVWLTVTNITAISNSVTFLDPATNSSRYYRLETNP